MTPVPTLDPVDWTAWADDPYPLYRLLRDESPVYYDEPNDTYVLTRFDDVYGVLRQHDTYSNVPLGILQGNLARTSDIRMADPPVHTLRRRIVKPMFIPGEMRRITPYLHEVSRELIDAVAGDDVVDITDAFAIALPGRVTLDIIGLPREVHDSFRALTDERIRIILGRTGATHEPPEARAEVERIRAALWEIVGPIAQERRREPRHDVMTLVVQARDEHGPEVIPDDVFINLLAEVLTAGFETTQHLIELLLDRCADDPELWARLRADRALIGPAMEEMLRYKSPTQALGRRPVQDVTFHGVEIAKDSWITISYASANRDERQFPDPDTYIPDRDLRKHVAFSYGIHYCAGAPLTRYEVTALLHELLDRFETIERAGESTPWPTTFPGRIGKPPGLRHVPVRLREAA
jgi:cytochrome P450